MRRFYLFLTVVLFLFFSCANNIADNKNDLAAMLILQNLQNKETSNTTVKYGSITINTGNSESRATDVASISKATVTVYWGNKAEEKKDASVDFSGNGIGSVTINEIPVGKNRIVVVEAAENFNNIINKMAGIEISAVTDIKAGNNNVTVNWKSTAEGNVYRRLLSSSKRILNCTSSFITKIKRLLRFLTKIYINITFKLQFVVDKIHSIKNNNIE